MRVCLIGDFTPYFNEGKQNVIFYLTQELSGNSHEVLTLHPRKVFSKDFWRALKSFQPEIIHYIPGPTPFSFAIMRFLALFCNKAKTVMSATHPSFPAFSRKFIPLFKPDLIIVQSDDTEKLFQNLGVKTYFLPNGVDFQRFVPIPKQAKKNLRKKYNLDLEKFLILHVGHITRERNLEILGKLQQSGSQVLVIGSPSIRVDKEAWRSLTEKGCHVHRDYFRSIEEIYALADLYVFPLRNQSLEQRRGSIDIPISVLEAMACNLPVVSTKYRGLARILTEGGGLIFVNSEDELLEAVQRVKNGKVEVKTREKVMPYSWDKVAKMLEGIYEQFTA